MDRKISSIAFILAIIFFTVSFTPVKAAERCETQYGGEETCVRTGELQIDKEILNSDSDEFVDNLSFRGKTFASNEEITFKLKVKNVGDETLFNIDVKDELPEFLFFTEGFDGEYSIDKLNPGDSDERTFKARVVAESKLPAEKSIICTVNTAEAEADNNESDRDTAQFCIGKKVLGITTLPKTGSNILLLASISFIAIFSGFFGLAYVKTGKRI